MDSLILLIEDDLEQIAMYKFAFLQQADLKLVCTDKQTEAIKIAKKKQPALILLDLLLNSSGPQSGLKVLENLKQEPQTKDIPVVVFTNYSKKDVLEKAKQIGAQEAWIKAQLVPKEVIAKVRNFLAARS